MTVSTVHIEWYGEGFKANVQEAAAKGLNASAEMLKALMSRNIGEQGPPRSAPGGFPHMETRSLKQSLGVGKATPVNLVASAGSRDGYVNSVNKVPTNDYGLYLEFGTRKMAPRPWLIRSLDDNRTAILAEFIETARRWLPDRTRTIGGPLD